MPGEVKKKKIAKRGKREENSQRGRKGEENSQREIKKAENFRRKRKRSREHQWVGNGAAAMLIRCQLWNILRGLCKRFPPQNSRARAGRNVFSFTLCQSNGKHPENRLILPFKPHTERPPFWGTAH